MQWVLPIIRNLVPEQRRQAFDNGIKALEEYAKTHKVNNAGDAMRALADFKVPTDFLSNIGGLDKIPIVSQAARICGVDTGKIAEDMKALSGVSSSLEQYKRDLENLK